MNGSTVAVLSDAHLGDQRSWLEQEEVQEGVVSALAQRPAVKTLVLLGDTLDLDFGTLVTAVEGRLHGTRRHPGLRALLGRICAESAVDEIVYVPGNHDYAVWDWEATQRNALDPLARGERIRGSALFAGTFDDPFLAGLMPDGRRHQLKVVFPHHVVTVAGSRVVLAHGHHLSSWQCGGVALAGVCRLPEGERADFLDRLYKASAQYQAFARDIAIRRSFRVASHRTYTTLTAPLDWLCSLLNSIGEMRGQAPSSSQLHTIDVYLHCVVKEPAAAAFVYGHTHVPGRWSTRGSKEEGWPATPVYNSGSFVPPRDHDASLLLLGEVEGKLAVDLVEFTSSGQHRARRLSDAPAEGKAQP